MPRRTTPTPIPPATRDPAAVAGRHCHLIGIAGCGMSALARMLIARGAIVTGSDMAPAEATDQLARLGVGISFDQRAAQLPEETDLVIASAAVSPDNPEHLAATQRGIETISYPEALGRMMLARTGIALAGTHGKSTTTAMLAHALIHAGLDPSVIVGATTPHLAQPGHPPTGFRLGADTIPAGPMAGQPGLLLAEACEFNRSFHNLHPTIATIMSVEADHLDIYGSLDAVVQAFAEFAARLPAQRDGGKLLIAHDGAHRREITAATHAQVHTIGFAPAADWVLTYDNDTRRVGLSNNNKLVATWINRLPGIHMATNSAVAATLAIWLGAEPATVAEALASFTGLDRRMQFLAEHREPHWDTSAPPVRVYDDYGHHPTEIEATLRALRDAERPEQHAGRLICVFQPHQHSRTRFLLEEFAQSFAHADVVIVPHIYFVRDSEIEKTKVSAADLVDRLRQRGVQAMHLYPFEAIVEQLQIVCRPGDLLVVMGAGPVWQVARKFLDRA